MTGPYDADIRLLEFLQKIQNPALRMTQSLDPFHINSLVEYVEILEETAQPHPHNQTVLLLIYSYLSFWQGHFFGSALFARGALKCAPANDTFEAIYLYKKALNLYAQYVAPSVSPKIKAQKKSLSLNKEFQSSSSLHLIVLDLLDIEFCARLHLQENLDILTENFLESWQSTDSHTLREAFEIIALSHAPKYWQEHHYCPRLEDTLAKLKHQLHLT